MIIGIGMETTGPVAIGRIDVVRRHAAEIYVAPAIGEFFDCKCWRSHTESIFFGPWANVERAHAMLAAIRSAMDREFADFFGAGASDEHPKTLAASFSKGMGQRISERLHRFKAEQTAAAYILARGRALAAALARGSRGDHAQKGGPHASLGAAMAYSAGVEAGDRVELPGQHSRWADRGRTGT